MRVDLSNEHPWSDPVLERGTLIDAGLSEPYDPAASGIAAALEAWS